MFGLRLNWWLKDQWISKCRLYDQNVAKLIQLRNPHFSRFILSEDAYPYNDPEDHQSPDQPPLNHQHHIPKELAKVLDGCVRHTPQERTSLLVLESSLNAVLSSKFGIPRRQQNLIDSILTRLGAHAEELEHQVEKRTADLVRERERCDEYLEVLLPK